MTATASTQGGEQAAPAPATAPARRRLNQPRVAEIVAGMLRERIVGGQLEDGELLPKQEELLKEFGVSLPSLREATRILETEGLISVRRGNVGGAVVHRPSSETVAFTLGLVLQSHRATPADLAAALQVVEPACAAMCARQGNRRHTAARLRTLVDEAASQLHDGPAFTTSARGFHDELARRCGNETLRELVATLEALWSECRARLAGAGGGRQVRPNVSLRQKVQAAHAAIAEAVGAGDAGRAERAVRQHLEQSHQLLLRRSGNQPLAITGPHLGMSAPRLGRAATSF